MLGLVVAPSTRVEISLVGSIISDISFDDVGSESNPIVDTRVNVAL
jgi:hypothetical protein